MSDLHERLVQAALEAYGFGRGPETRQRMGLIVDALLAVLSSEQASTERIDEAARAVASVHGCLRLGSTREILGLKPCSRCYEVARRAAGPVVVRDSGERLSEQERDEVMLALRLRAAVLASDPYYVKAEDGRARANRLDSIVAKLERGASVSPSERCEAVCYVGPGHQSRVRCELPKGHPDTHQRSVVDYEWERDGECVG